MDTVPIGLLDHKQTVMLITASTTRYERSRIVSVGYLDRNLTADVPP